MTKKIFIVYHSGYGHTEKLAEAVLEGAKSVPETEVTLMKSEDAIKNIDTLKEADAIIFGAPTYMGSLSAKFKEFMDASSKPWFTQDWSGKLAAGFTNSSTPSGDKLNSLMQLVILASQHGMIWVSLGQTAVKSNYVNRDDPENINRMGFYLGAAGQSRNDAGPDQDPPQADLSTGKLLGKRVATIAHKYNN